MKKLVILILLIFTAAGSLSAQDKQELEAEKIANARLKGEHPLTAIIKAKPAKLRPELRGVHPRVYLSQSDLEALRKKSQEQPELWNKAISTVRALTVEPPAAPAQERRVQNDVGIGIAEAAFVYKISGDKKYLAAAKKYMDAAVSYDVWGYTYNKPDIDLAAGHLLYGMGSAYDLLYHDLTPAERDKYRAKMIRQSRLMFEFFKQKDGKSYAYSQNHTFIPIAGLAVTAYALMDETDEAANWASLSRAIFDRVLATYTDDGYFYESMEYWIFSTPWLVHYMDAHKQSTGENLYQSTPGFRLVHKYISHITLPGGEFNFDYGDIYAGNITRSRQGDDYTRERINGNFKSNYNILYRLADEYRNPEAQGVAEWVKSKGQVNAEEFWTFIWYNPSITPVPIEKQPKWHYFEDHDVIFWRDSWGDDATAFSFKCGPPEGHATFMKQDLFPDWRLSSGHAHPDAGSFIIWSGGKYLTGDSGYAGVPMTLHHNSVLFDGRGQAREGAGHDAFSGIPYERLNKIRIISAAMFEDRVTILADVGPAYEPELGVEKFVRKFEFKAPGTFVISDKFKLKYPQIISSYLHADNKIDTPSLTDLIFEAGKGPSMVAKIMSPKEFTVVVEPNYLTAPGRPGSVDKGEVEKRGVRAAVSTKEKVDKADFKIRFEIRK